VSTYGLDELLRCLLLAFGIDDFGALGLTRNRVQRN
jgi:hypothetical protein